MAYTLEAHKIDTILDFSDKLLDNLIGKDMFEEWESLKPLKKEWIRKLFPVLKDIVIEYNEWFEGD